MSSLAETVSANAVEARLAADARKVADRVDHPNRKYRRNREQAAAIVERAIGVPFGPEALRKVRCPYLYVAGRALYADQDLIELATAILDRAIRRGATPKPASRPTLTPTDALDGGASLSTPTTGESGSTPAVLSSRRAAAPSNPKGRTASKRLDGRPARQMETV
jgi:hypothetical protein